MTTMLLALDICVGTKHHSLGQRLTVGEGSNEGFGIA